MGREGGRATHRTSPEGEEEGLVVDVAREGRREGQLMRESDLEKVCVREKEREREIFNHGRMLGEATTQRD